MASEFDCARCIHAEVCPAYMVTQSECKHYLSAEDVAAVVRCKDCRHYRNYGRTSLVEDGRNIAAGWCYRRIRYDEEFRTVPNDFCSYGERKN